MIGSFRIIKEIFDLRFGNSDIYFVKNIKKTVIYHINFVII